MPLDVSKLKRLTENSPLYEHERIVLAMQRLKETLDAQQFDMSEATANVVMAQGARLRAEAAARQATIETRDLAIRQNKNLEQLLAEARSKAAFWKNTAAALFVGLIVAIVGWLLTAANAAQVLSNLFHH